VYWCDVERRLLDALKAGVRMRMRSWGGANRAYPSAANTARNPMHQGKGYNR